MGINKDHCGELFGSGQTIYSVNFKAQHISATGVPWDRLTLADIAKEMMSGAVGDLFYLKLDLFGSLEPDVFELNLHPFVVYLQTDGSVIQSSTFGVVGELGSGFAVDEEPEVVSAGDDVDVVPLVWADVRHSERPGDTTGMWLTVLVDDQPRPAGAGIFLAPGEMEIPRAENMRTNADMSEVGVITFEWPLAGQVGFTADLDAGVAFARQAITQLKFKVSKMLILPNEIGQSVGAAVPDNRSIANGPVGRTLGRNGSPARKDFAIEDGGKTVCVSGPLWESGGNDAA